MSEKIETALFAAGCFWGVEDGFRAIPGVIDAVSGYCGGTVENPTYEQVCTGCTGHAETVEISYDPSRVTFAELLETFWTMHDPTTLNRQGPDVGTQYRSAVFYLDAEQEKIAREAKKQLNDTGRFSRPVVTEITPAVRFYRAEEYHQRYFEKHGISHCPVTPTKRDN